MKGISGLFLASAFTFQALAQTQGYVSSHLPFVTGDLVQRHRFSEVSRLIEATSLEMSDGAWEKYTQWGLVNLERRNIAQSSLVREDIIGSAKNSSILERLLGTRTSLDHAKQTSGRYHDIFLKPDEPHWAGLCHQWAGAAYHPEMGRFLHHTLGLICGPKGILLGPGELQEGLTALYTYTSPGRIARGGKVNSQTGWENTNPIRRAMGLNDYLPSTHHELTQEFIGKTKTSLTLDLNSNDRRTETWNEPVKSIRRTEKTYEQGQIRALLLSNSSEGNQFLEGINARFFEFPPGSNERCLLRTLKSVNVNLGRIQSIAQRARDAERLNDSQEFLAHKRAVIDEFKLFDHNCNRGPSIGAEIGHLEHEANLKFWSEKAIEIRRHILQNHLRPAIAENRIRLRPGSTLKRYDDNLTLISSGSAKGFGVYVPSSQIKEKTLALSYWIARYPDIDEFGTALTDTKSVWISPPEDVPDFGWTSSFDTFVADVSDQRKTELADTLKNILTLVDKKECTPLRKIFTFFGIFQSMLASNENVDSTNMRSSFENMFKEICPVLSMATLSKVIEGYTGITPQIILTALQQNKCP